MWSFDIHYKKNTCCTVLCGASSYTSGTNWNGIDEVGYPGNVGGGAGAGDHQDKTFKHVATGNSLHL